MTDRHDPWRASRSWEHPELINKYEGETEDPSVTSSGSPWQSCLVLAGLFIISWVAFGVAIGLAVAAFRWIAG